MILGIELFKSNEGESSGASIVPLAFPMIAGAGSITSLLSLKAEYSYLNISIALALNMIIVYIILKNYLLGRANFRSGWYYGIKKSFWYYSSSHCY